MTESTMKEIKAQGEMHHQYFLGLQLMVNAQEGAEIVGQWMFNLFRQQHLDKFLSSFHKLGLSDQPDAVACAKYHVLSNGVGGVRVEYIEESDKKSWVRFRYPRWMYAGPAICGIPVEASRGFLKGWYAHNGVSLKNPRLGYVCVSEDLTGQFGLCGYFKEYDHDLQEHERLQFSPDEIPPPFDPDKQPTPPSEQWDDMRLAKGARNYALEYCRNGLIELARLVGEEKTLKLGKKAARLTGLQNYQNMADAVGAVDDDYQAVAAFLKSMLEGMGDEVQMTSCEISHSATLVQSGLRVVRGIEGAARQQILECWVELWRGCIDSHQQFFTTEITINDEKIIWTIVQRERVSL